MIKNKNIMTRIPLFIRVVSLYIIVCIFVLLGLQVQSTLHRQYEFSYSPNDVTYRQKQINYGNIVSKTIIDGEPQTFIMERLGINLPIEYGYYDSNTNSWTVSDDAIYFGYGTALPNNQKGNTFLYGHNRDSVIAKLKDLVVGDEIIIVTKNGHSFKYYYVNDEYVKPNYIGVLHDNPETPRLTIMTCDGIWSLTRRLMYFELKEVI